MNKILIFLTVLLSLMSCSKNSSNNNITGQDVAGTYTSSTGTQTIVSTGTNGRISLKYIPCCTNPYYQFDSVKLASDLSITVNEYIQEPQNLSGSIRKPEQYTGTGNFSPNKIHYDFKSVRGVNRILFDGVR